MNLLKCPDLKMRSPLEETRILGPLQNDHKNPYIRIYGSSKEPYIRIYGEGLALTSNIPIFDISWYRTSPSEDGKGPSETHRVGIACIWPRWV
jgi:hypothetical protein